MLKKFWILMGFAFPALGNSWFSVSDEKWVVKTDKSERPSVGKSTLHLSVNKILQAKGLLYALAGKEGPVGFALVEINKPIDASASRELCFNFKGSPTGAHYQVLLKDDQADQPEGILTFQRDFVATSKEQKLCFPFSEFVASIRGKHVSGFKLKPETLKSFSVQISRSRQEEPLLSQSPLPFEFFLSGKVLTLK